MIALRLRQQHKRKPLAGAPILEGRKRCVPGEGDLVQVVHACPAERTIGHGEAGRLYDVCCDAQAGAKPQNRAGILGNVRLVKGDSHGRPRGLLGRDKPVWRNDCATHPSTSGHPIGADRMRPAARIAHMM
jgi:hypothetical protein